ncbi:MAG TPA: hypothetical protein VFS20_02170 [Longimicrobium sp.]|nr:hypothetical protein [Longimicrobium sp.]
MRKLTLHPDDLRVESFETLPAAALFRRTVRAHQDDADADARSGGANCEKTETCDGKFTCNGGMSCDTECTDHTCDTPNSCTCESPATGWCCPKA